MIPVSNKRHFVAGKGNMTNKVDCEQMRQDLY